MHDYEPDYQNLVKSAQNIDVERTPLYEHIICPEIIEQALDRPMPGSLEGSLAEKKEYFAQYCRFFLEMGYDTVSFEECISTVMPGSGALGGGKKGFILNRADFEKYPWDEIPDIYFQKFGENFQALREMLPPGMKAVGGVGNGVFECVQDVVGFMDLCYIAEDDPDLYASLFARSGQVNYMIWERFMREYGDIYCVLRFGDDLGFKSNTLLHPKDIRSHIIPQYKKVIDLVHSYHKPFLLHSCGSIFSVMDDLIAAGIDAKHSNEDQIMPFPVWVEKYGSKIGNFGGIDTDMVCRLSHAEMKDYITDVYRKCKGRGGFAFGSGNSIPKYVPIEGYLSMVGIFRELRGDAP
jgi:uroporphyrinogen decarboxylase